MIDHITQHIFTGRHSVTQGNNITTHSSNIITLPNKGNIFEVEVATVPKIEGIVTTDWPNGSYIELVFDGVCTIVYSPSLVLKSGSDYVTMKDTIMQFRKLNGVWKEVGTTSIGGDFIKFSQYSTSFDGVNERVNIGDVTELAFERTDTFSISVWYKTSSSGTYALFSKKDKGGNNTGYALKLDSASSKFILEMVNESGVNEAIASWTYSGSAFHDGNWHHVLMMNDGTGDATGLELYVDNIQRTLTIDVNTLSLSILVNKAAYIGSIDDTFEYAGNIDDVSIWDKVLDSTDRDQLYNNGKPKALNTHPSAANRAGVWRMGDDDTSPNIIDHSGNGNTGLMVNMTQANFVQDTAG